MRPRYKVCPACRGEGAVFGRLTKDSPLYRVCPLCKGEGKIDTTEIAG